MIVFQVNCKMIAGHFHKANGEFGLTWIERRACGYDNLGFLTMSERVSKVENVDSS